MSLSIFDHFDYKKYLVLALNAENHPRGVRSRLAEELGCEPAFISRVLNGNAHFSQENALTISEFLKHSSAESEFFILLLLMNRAGSKTLKDFYTKLIEKIRRSRQEISQRVRSSEELSLQNQVTYYSSWYYAAIHTLLLIPGFSEKNKIYDYLKIPKETVSLALDFLVRSGLVKETQGKYHTVHSRLHLGRQSPLISKHHANWRNQALQSVERGNKEGLHYSGPICISHRDSETIKELLLELTEKVEKIVKPSKEESVHCLNFDFFEI